jgi:catechol 2,3-dioxygenase-like lactoylglutathione lyase family enzyme
MIYHMSYAVKDFEKSRDFYDKTLSCLDCERIVNIEDAEHCAAGYGKKGGAPTFFVIGKKNLSDKDKAEEVGNSRGFHVCFAVPNKSSVNDWHSVCLSSGGKDNGKPGPRDDFPGHYTGYIVDPDGWRIEAACMEQ